MTRCQRRLAGVLRCKGVPKTIRTLIHTGKTAQVSSEGGLSCAFGLETGQGCCLAPLLFNIHFGAVGEAWQALFTRADGILRRQTDPSRHARHEMFKVREMGF